MSDCGCHRGWCWWPRGLEVGKLGQVHLVNVQWVDVGHVPDHVRPFPKSFVANVTGLVLIWRLVLVLWGWSGQQTQQLFVGRLLPELVDCTAGLAQAGRLDSLLPTL